MDSLVSLLGALSPFAWPTVALVGILLFAAPGRKLLQNFTTRLDNAGMGRLHAEVAGVKLSLEFDKMDKDIRMLESMDSSSSAVIEYVVIPDPPPKELEAGPYAVVESLYTLMTNALAETIHTFHLEPPQHSLATAYASVLFSASKISRPTRDVIDSLEKIRDNLAESPDAPFSAAQLERYKNAVSHVVAALSLVD